MWGGRCGIGVTTAREYLVRAQAAGLSWPLPEDLLDEALERMLFAAGPAAGSGEEDRELPDWSAVRLELCRKKGVTLQLLWQEYRAAHPDGYGYSRYCELYRAWAKTLDVTMRFTHQAGEVLFGDYAGETMEVTNPQTGEIIPVYVFVGGAGCKQLHVCRAEGEGEGESEGEGEPKGADDAEPNVAHVIIFSGEKQIDLRDLMGVSEILAEAGVDSATYTKIRIEYKDPMLTLVNDPETVITDIQEIANNHLFIDGLFEVPEGRSIILLDFQGLHLVQTGQGKLVWTPQLRADITVEDAAVATTGTIESIDPVAQTFVLAVTDTGDSLTVSCAAAVIYLPGEVDVPGGSSESLLIGQSVSVEGLLKVSGEIEAAVIRIQS